MDKYDYIVFVKGDVESPQETEELVRVMDSAGSKGYRFVGSIGDLIVMERML